MLRILSTLKTRFLRAFHRLSPNSRDWITRTLKVTTVVLVCYLVFGAIMAIPIYRGSETWLTRAAESMYPYPALTVKGTTIPLSRYRLEVSARQTYAATHSLESTPEQTRQFVIDQLIARALYAYELKQRNVIITDGDVDTKIEEISNQVGGEDKLRVFLAQNYGENVTLAVFRTWIYESLVEAAMKQQVLVHASVRHILVAVPEGADQKTIDAARAKAADIRTKITSVDAFSEVAKQYSEDIASKDKGGELGSTARGDAEPVFSQEFEQLVFTIPVGQISEPVRSRYGWHIVIVDERDGSIDMSASELLEQLRAQSGVKVYVKASY